MSEKLSKFLSYVLRHKPEEIGITLDANGWVAVSELLVKSKKSGREFSEEDLFKVVEDCEKQRYTLSDDRKKIRAAQGHSVKVDLGVMPSIPPPVLYHGTASRFLNSIYASGLTPQSRQQVHLSSDILVANQVGKRHGSLVVFTIDTVEMVADGFSFFLADNNVWLTDVVPVKYLKLLG